MSKIVVTVVAVDGTEQVEVIEDQPMCNLYEYAAFQIIRHSAYKGSGAARVGTKVTLEVIE